MEIIMAKTSGFCFGVNKAIEMVNQLLAEEDTPIYTIGPIIHNEQVVEDLKSKGVQIVNEAKEAKYPGNIVVRTHGITPKEFEELEKSECKYIDATCPYVKKIHLLVKGKVDEGYQIIIVGDKNHPEVKGIDGWSNHTAIIVYEPEDIEMMDASIQKELCIVAQTTITKEKWLTITEKIKNKFKNTIEFDTICNATNARQNEAEKISKIVDLMIVIGGKSSSNTQKLYEICKNNCKETYKIETFGELPPLNIKTIQKVGITAGASTPEWIIKEVIEKMDELNKQENAEISFMDAYESSLVTLRSGEIAKGKIIGFNHAEVFVDLGYKSDGIIPMEEFTDEPDFVAEEVLKIGEEIEVYIVRVNDGEGNVMLSKKKVDASKNLVKVEEAYEKGIPVQAKVTEIVNGGLIASAGGVKIFIPASQISDRFVKDLKEFLKQTIDVKIIEYNKQKRKLVGSRKELLKGERTRNSSQVWDSIEVGKVYEGIVKSLTDFGAFVDIGGVDGLIYITEIAWSKIKHPSEVFKVGDAVSVFILEFDKEKKRISLGYKKAENNPWNTAAEKYHAGDIVSGKVARLVPFGAFIELEDGIDGLVHISQISNTRIGKPADILQIGQTIEVKILEINLETKKISLSIKEVNPAPVIETAIEEIVQEAKPIENIEDSTITTEEIVGETADKE